MPGGFAATLLAELRLEFTTHTKIVGTPYLALVTGRLPVGRSISAPTCGRVKGDDCGRVGHR